MRRTTQAFLFSLSALLLSLVSLGPSSSRSQDSNEVVVVLNARNPTSALTKDQLRKLFMGSTGFWHGVVPVKVFLRPASGDASKAFLEPVLGKSPQAFAKHWDKLQLSGRAVAPVTVGSAAELAAAIAKTPGGIGFALASEAWEVAGVKVIPVR